MNFPNLTATYILIGLHLIGLCPLVLGQVGINTVTPDESSILHIESADKGVLFPRMTMAQRNGINTTATANGRLVPEGLTIYCTDCCTNGLGALFFYNGTAWRSMDGDCRPIGEFPSCINVTTSFLTPQHLDSNDIPLLFDDLLTDATQTNSNDLRIHQNADIMEFSLNEPVTLGGKVVIYWTDVEWPANLGLLVDLEYQGTTSQASIDTFLGTLPNSTNVGNGANNYILTITMVSDTDTITVQSYDDTNGADPRVLEFRILDDNDNEILETCN